MPFKKYFPEVIESKDSLQIFGNCSGMDFGSTIRVLIWNMYKGRLAGWKDDFEYIIRDKELVVLQESIKNTVYDALFSGADRFEWVMAKTHKNQITQATTGVKTGSIIKSTGQSYYMTRDVEPFLRTPKMLLATTYPLTGYKDELLVVNIHAINFVTLAKYSRQLTQMVEAVGDHKGPVILAGDFNTWNSARFKGLREAVKNMGLKEIPLTRKGRLAHLNKDLDHVFFRGLDVVKTEVLMGVKSSDHYPIVVEFSVQDSKGD
jgi:endonuclease/exonuclease/phosphatase (EEP) superfamily protein YafD